MEWSCAICSEEFNSQSDPTALDCGHIYHHSCVLNWITDAEHGSCPVCRQYPTNLPLLYPAFKEDDEKDKEIEDLQRKVKEIENMAAVLEERIEIVTGQCAEARTLRGSHYKIEAAQKQLQGETNIRKNLEEQSIAQAAEIHEAQSELDELELELEELERIEREAEARETEAKERASSVELNCSDGRKTNLKRNRYLEYDAELTRQAKAFKFSSR